MLMVVLGVLIGAPLVAREVEPRTQLVAWTQWISRRRWYSAKTAILATCLALAGLLAGLANDRTQIPLNHGGLTSSRWIWFFSIDLAPAAEAVLAFALAVAIGAYSRRTLPAIGAALVSFLALFLLTGRAVRDLTRPQKRPGPKEPPLAPGPSAAGTTTRPTCTGPSSSPTSPSCSPSPPCCSSSVGALPNPAGLSDPDKGLGLIGARRRLVLDS